MAPFDAVLGFHFSVIICLLKLRFVSAFVFGSVRRSFLSVVSSTNPCCFRLEGRKFFLVDFFFAITFTG